MTHPIELREHVVSDSALEVDEDKGVIRNVRVLGLSSANGRTYSREAVRKAIGLYENKVVNVNHTARPSEQRSASDRLGWLQGVRQDPDGGLRGDLHYLRSHPMAGPLAEAARRNPALFGMSHTARGRQSYRDGAEVIEAIESVTSVDLVAEPATASGLHESRSQPVKRKIKDLIESLKGKRPGYARALKEQAEAGILGPEAEMEAPPEEGAGDESKDHKKAIRDACKAIIDDDSLDEAAMMKKLKALIKMLGGDDSGGVDDDTGMDDPPPAEESRRRKEHANLREEVALLKAEKTVRKAAEQARVELSGALVEALARPGMTDQQAAAVVAELKGHGAAGSQKPRSAPPPPQQQSQRAANGGGVAVREGQGGGESLESIAARINGRR